MLPGADGGEATAAAVRLGRGRNRDRLRRVRVHRASPGQVRDRAAAAVAPGSYRRTRILKFNLG